MDFAQKAAESIARCRSIAAYTEVPGETTRLYLSPAMEEVHALLGGWMRAAGMEVRVDAAGNLRGLYPALHEATPRLLIGSHLDTVPNSGAFDGVLGVVLGLALVEEFGGARLPFAIEVAGFSEEEGIRFRKPFLGSLALVGGLDEAALALRDSAGISVAEAVTRFGLAERSMDDALLAPETFAYVEFHIEQGPVLEAVGRPLGVVEAIAGQTRLEFVFTGQANHAGTTPMVLRHDAMAACAEWMVDVERYARACTDLVATVGRVEARPGAVNVVPGEVIATLDVRHASDAAREAAVSAMLRCAEDAGTERGVGVAWSKLMEQAAVPMDAALVSQLLTAAHRAGFACDAMVSGAGHDAMILAEKVPSAMLFLRSPGGLSHHPDEAVLAEDVAAALATGMELLRGLGEAAPVGYRL